MAQGGKTLNDRKLAAEVRTLSLREMKKVLEGDDADYKKQLILKLAATALPRLNEHTGADGEPLNLNYDKSFASSSPATDKPQG